MHCKQVQKRLSEDWVAATQRPEIARHMATCASCAAAWAQLQGAMALVEGLPEPTVPAALYQRVRAALPVRASRQPVRWWRYTAFAGAAAAMLLTVLWPPRAAAPLPASMEVSSYLVNHDYAVASGALGDSAAYYAIAMTTPSETPTP